MKSVQIRDIFWSVFSQIWTEDGKIRTSWSLFTQGVFSANGVEAYSELCQTSKDGITVQKMSKYEVFLFRIFSFFN